MDQSVSLNVLKAYARDGTQGAARVSYFTIDWLDSGYGGGRTGISLGGSVAVTRVKALVCASASQKSEGVQSRVSEAITRTLKERKSLEKLAVLCYRQLR